MHDLEDRVPAARVIEIIESHLSANAGRVASVLVGPRREGWFNSEAFVALLGASNPLDPGGFSVYGEENFRTVLAKLGWTGVGGDPSALPDLVGYGSDDAAPPVFILEAKLVYDHDRDQGAAAINKLAAQIDNARQIVPGVPVIGVVYAARSPAPGDAAAFLGKVSSFMEQELPVGKGYDWVRGRRVDIVPGLESRLADFKAWSSYSSLGLGARVAR
jgi:hypothetical protein